MLDNLEQDIFNTMPADGELDFQNHTVEQHSQKVICLWLVYAQDNSFVCLVLNV